MEQDEENEAQRHERVKSRDNRGQEFPFSHGTRTHGPISREVWITWGIKSSFDQPGYGNYMRITAHLLQILPTRFIATFSAVV